jgi:hypothetical protein
MPSPRNHTRPTDRPRSRFGPLLRSIAQVSSIVLLAGLVPAPPLAAGATSDTSQVELSANPGTPPAPLPDRDRTPPLAGLDEDGLRDPAATVLTLPDATADGTSEFVTPVPRAGGPDVDVFSIGEPGTTHGATSTRARSTFVTRTGPGATSS